MKVNIRILKNANSNCKHTIIFKKTRTCSNTKIYYTKKSFKSPNSLGSYSPIVLTPSPEQKKASKSPNSLGSYSPIVLTPSPEQLKASNSPLKSTNKTRSRRTRNNRNKKQKNM